MALDADFLDELSRLEATLRRETDSRRQGEQRSPNVGEGLTFSDYRRYTPGDDVRLIDWRVHARTDEYFIKQYEAEPDLTVHILLGTSASMAYRQGHADQFQFPAKPGLGFSYVSAAGHGTFPFPADDGGGRTPLGREPFDEFGVALEAVWVQLRREHAPADADDDSHCPVVAPNRA